MLKVIHAAEDVLAARDKARQMVVANLRDLRLTKAADLVENGIETTLTYYQFPEGRWRRFRTNSPLYCILREIRRRTRVVGASPDRECGPNLMGETRTE